MHNVMISKPTCKTLLLPLCALKPRKGFKCLSLYTRQFIPVRKKQPVWSNCNNLPVTIGTILYTNNIAPCLDTNEVLKKKPFFVSRLAFATMIDTSILFCTLQHKG